MNGLPLVTYLSMDALDEGVGASQVLTYVERLGHRGVAVELHSFEKRAPDPAIARRLAAAGATWRPHPFGRLGAVGGLGRVARAAWAARRAALVHARGDLAALAAVLARPRRWLWDVRALFSDQRVVLGTLRAGSPEDRLLRWVEQTAARHADGVVTLAGGAIAELEQRHHVDLHGRASVIPTCVDLDRFALAPMPTPEPAVLMLAGTLNAYYDVPAMLALVDALARRRPTELHVVAPGSTAWDERLAAVASVRRQADFDGMPALVATAHVGLSVCREDAGPSLRAAMPTKIAEFLAVGRPVVVNPSLGDAGRLVVEHRVGVTLAGVDGADAAAEQLHALLDDPDLPARCRRLAEEHFDLERGVDRLVERYAAIARAGR